MKGALDQGYFSSVWSEGKINTDFKLNFGQSWAAVDEEKLASTSKKDCLTWTALPHAQMMVWLNAFQHVTDLYLQTHCN